MPLGDTTFSRPAARSFQLYSPSAPRPDQSPSPTIQPFQNPTSEIQARGLYDDDGVRSWVSLATALTQRDSRDDGFTDLGESASQLEVRLLAASWFSVLRDLLSSPDLSGLSGAKPSFSFLSFQQAKGPSGPTKTSSVQ
eukprot:m.541857 g.541857  ORF g.541857 m.541857 type:complete len:139 (+) comp57653_c0_seq7:1184-1600(+)